VLSVVVVVRGERSAAFHGEELLPVEPGFPGSAGYAPCAAYLDGGDLSRADEVVDAGALYAEERRDVGGLEKLFAGVHI
jgi:hypothetical protein